MSGEDPSLLPKEEEDLKPKGDQQEEAHSGQHNSLLISDMEPLTKEAYGGGMYGHDDENGQKRVENTGKKPASDTQSADGPVGPNVEPKHKPPPSTGDRDVDITG